MTHYYRTFLELPKSFSEIVCQSPVALSNKALYQISDDNLNCINTTERMSDDLNVLSDLNFRDIF